MLARCSLPTLLPLLGLVGCGPPRGLEAAVTRALESLGGRAQAAVELVDLRTGAVLERVGPQWPRPAGTSLKPFLALAALRRGVSPATEVDEPRAGARWIPEDYAPEPEPALLLATALRASRSTPMVLLYERVGPEGCVETLRQLGITAQWQGSPEDCAFGAASISLRELTQAWARAAASAEGRAWLGLLARLDLRDATGFELSGKRGVSSDRRDAYFLGSSREVAVGVWVGGERPSRGSAAAAERLWLEVISSR